MEYNTITGYFLPSGYYGNQPGYYTWINHCPMCEGYNTLAYNPKGTYEGEITCMWCDSDFDGTSGADKDGSGARAWLTPYYPPPEPVVSKKETTQKKPTKLELMVKHIQTHKNIL